MLPTKPNRHHLASENKNKNMKRLLRNLNIWQVLLAETVDGRSDVVTEVEQDGRDIQVMP